MKGLILKDLLNLKKQASIIIVMVVFYFVLSVTSKNYGMFNAIILILFAMLPITAISFDERANWDKYGLTMPVSRADMVISKYILGFLLVLVALCINIFGQLLMGTKMNQETLTVAYFIFGLALLFMALLLPIMFKFGVEKGRMIMFIVFLMPTAVVFLAPKIIKTPISEELIMKCFYYLPLVFILLFALLSHFT